MQDALDQTPPALQPRAAPRPDERPSRDLARFAVVAAGLCLVAFELPAIAPAWVDMSTVFLQFQDRWLLLGAAVLFAMACLRLPAASRPLLLPAWAPWTMALAIVVVCVAGHHWILCGYDMSRDEQMAVFDSRIFSAGRLVEPLPVLWQQHADALNLTFMLPVSHPIAWVSAYLPMNAMLRALTGLVADPTLTGPLLTGLGLLVLWLCARRLWPQERETGLVAVLLYVTSGQVLFAGMTAFAMPAHLTLDLLWLWLFLRARTTTDLAALAVAAVATGLHQPLFHPLFALQFLVGLVRDRAWGRVMLYAAGYAIICAFWLAWPIWMHALIAGPGSQTQAAGTDYLSRLIVTVTSGNEARVPDMVANLLRFAAWQPILMLPLMAAGVVLARRERPTLALAASVALPILVMGVILPYQGQGFGYRYLQPALGPALLLAVQGFRCLVRRDTRLRPLLLRTTLAGLVVIFPLQAYMTHAFFAPAAGIDARIRASGADYAIVGPVDAPFARALVLNRPDLSNRPLRLLGDEIDADLIASICKSGARVALPTSALLAPMSNYVEIPPSDAADRRLAEMSPRLTAAGCTVERLGP